MTRTEARRWLAVARRAAKTARPVSSLVDYAADGRHYARWWGIEASGRTEGEALQRLAAKVAARLDAEAKRTTREVVRLRLKAAAYSKAAAAVRKGAK